MRKGISSQKKIVRWIVLVAIFVVELFFYAWCRVQCVRIGYDIQNKIKQQNEIISEQNNFKLEIASLKSPERIAKIAKEKLGLSMPTPNQIVVMP
ncbi:MAG: cell division protein FtsL [Desulfobacterales bacterium]|nr:cell division protein FtsL [Desulfobacterales bacterium]